MITRRQLLTRAGMGFGAVAASALLEAASDNPLAPRKPPGEVKAKAIIYLFMHGGVSHVDTWGSQARIDAALRSDLAGEFCPGAQNEPH